jgi:hypothetical protein
MEESVLYPQLNRSVRANNERNPGAGIQPVVASASPFIVLNRETTMEEKMSEFVQEEF